jgi:hypothetical protein
MQTTLTRPRQPPCHPSDRPAFAGIEPGLGEILADPIVRTLMARDGVGVGDIRYLVDLIGRRRSTPPSIAGGSTTGARVTVDA